MATTPAFSVVDLSKQFESHPPALSHVNLTVDAGTFVSLLGPSGCGKSTLLRLIADLEQPSQGRIERDAHLQGRVSFVFQDPHLLPWRRVLENTLLPLELRKDPDAEKKARSALQRVGLSDALAFYPHQLSGGMRMRVSLARALCTDPRLLLLDEPFAALDEVTRLHLDEDLHRLWRQAGMTVVFVTHSLSEAVFLSQKVALISKATRSIANIQEVALPQERTAKLRSEPAFLNHVDLLRRQFEALGS